MDGDWQLPERRTVVVDTDYVLAAAGLLAAEHPDAAYRLVTLWTPDSLTRVSDQDGAPGVRAPARRHPSTRRVSPPGSPTSGPRCADTSTSPSPIEIAAGTSNFSRAEVPYGVDLAAAWSWRLLVIAAAAVLVGYLISFLAVMVIPVVVALLISALVVPLVDWLVRHGVRRSIAAFLVVIFTIAAVVALLTFAGQQVANGASDLADQTVDGLEEIKDWLATDR